MRLWVGGVGWKWKWNTKGGRNNFALNLIRKLESNAHEILLRIPPVCFVILIA